MNFLIWLEPVKLAKPALQEMCLLRRDWEAVTPSQLFDNFDETSFLSQDLQEKQEQREGKQQCHHLLGVLQDHFLLIPCSKKFSLCSDSVSYYGTSAILCRNERHPLMVAELFASPHLMGSPASYMSRLHLS